MEEERTIFLGAFKTKIAKFKPNDYHFYLSLDTTPKSLYLNTNKKFKTIKTARKYYIEQTKKVLLNALKEIEDLAGKQ